jgi:GNAT superfamily N-acetyltransferase
MVIDKSHIISKITEYKDKGYKGRESTYNHLKSALIEWDSGDFWNNEHAFIFTQENKGYVFILYSHQKNTEGGYALYCDLRHITVLEEYRGEGIGKKLLDFIFKHMKEQNSNIFKVTSDVKSSGFYKKLGFTPSGFTKPGHVYFCLDINTLNSFPMPLSDYPYIVTNKLSLL